MQARDNQAERGGGLAQSRLIMKNKDKKECFKFRKVFPYFKFNY